MCVLLNLVYLSFLFCAALWAAAPGLVDVLPIWDSAYVSGSVTSQAGLGELARFVHRDSVHWMAWLSATHVPSRRMKQECGNSWSQNSWKCEHSSNPYFQSPGQKRIWCTLELSECRWFQFFDYSGVYVLQHNEQNVALTVTHYRILIKRSSVTVSVRRPWGEGAAGSTLCKFASD